MGLLIDGRWTDDERLIRGGAFERSLSVFRDRIDIATVAAFREQPGRFVLIASLSCPWSHRTLILRRLKGLSETVPAQIAGGRREQGYSVNNNTPWTLPGTAKEILHVPRRRTWRNRSCKRHGSCSAIGSTWRDTAFACWVSASVAWSRAGPDSKPCLSIRPRPGPGA